MKFSFEEVKIGKLSSLYVEVENISLKNGYLISFIDKCFKTFLDRLYLKRPQYLTAEKKTLTLLFLFLKNRCFKIRSELQKVLKRTLGYCKTR